MGSFLASKDFELCIWHVFLSVESDSLSLHHIIQNSLFVFAALYLRSPLSLSLALLNLNSYYLTLSGHLHSAQPEVLAPNLCAMNHNYSN